MITLKDKIKNLALESGFSAVGIAGTEYLADAARNLQQMVSQKRHGEMDWLAATLKERPDPTAFFPGAKSILMVAYNYYRKEEPFFLPEDCGTISVYARGRDYHKVVRGKLKKLLSHIKELAPNTEGRIFVDSFPIMEKPLAVRAGLGWIGKNTMLIMKSRGSYFFLGGILLNLPLPADQPFSGDFCGSCNRCQQACPTGALTAPYQIDASRCISYLTIEHRSAIDPAFHSAMGNLIFGCDICQMVCPWNRFAQDSTESDFFSRFSANDLLLSRLSSLSKQEFEKMFEGTPVRRAGYERFRRNVEIARKNMKEAVE